MLASHAVTRSHIVGAWLGSGLVTKEYLLSHEVPKEVVLAAEDLLTSENMEKLKAEVEFFCGSDPSDALRFATVDGIWQEQKQVGLRWNIEEVDTPHHRHHQPHHRHRRHHHHSTLRKLTPLNGLSRACPKWHRRWG